MKNLIYPFIGMLFLMVFFTACEEDDTSTLGNDLRLLKVTSEGSDIESGDEVENENVALEFIFSHSLNTSAFESALAVNAPGYVVTYNETNSFATLSFPSLEYDTQYNVNLPAGSYGANGESMPADYSFSFITKAFVPANASLSVEKTELFEGDSSLVTVTLNEPTVDDVTVTLTTSGTAVQDTDYTLKESTLIIPMGSTSANTMLKSLNDSQTEGEESIIIEISEVINAVEDGEQLVSIALKDESPALVLKGVMALRWDTEADGNSGKAVHLKAKEDIADLSIYGLGVANNGGGTDEIEYTFPAIAVNAGEDILLSRDPAALEAYFEGACFTGFEHVIQTDEMTQNGDDAIELFKGTAVIETYGNADIDGTGMDWEYTSSWAYKLGDTWSTGGVNCSAGSSTSLGSGCVYPLCDNPLVLKGVMAILWDGSGTNGGKAVHLLANSDISDLSQYGIGVANNGGGTDGIEFTFPAISVAEGDHIVIARETATLASYFGNCFDGYDHVIESDAMNQNGDDAIELFLGADVIETYGDANVDGTGEVWEYAGSWAYKIGSSWTYGGVDCAATSTTTQSSACPYLFCE